MISRTELINTSAASTTQYLNQKNNEEGSKNLFVGGSAADQVFNSTDGSIILTGEGNDIVFSDSAYNQIETGAGSDILLVLGNNNNINVGDGNNSLVFEGDNININAGNGSNYIASLDFAMIDKKYGEFLTVDGKTIDLKSYIDNKTTQTTDKNSLVNQNSLTKEISRNTSTPTSTITGQEIVKQLSAAEQQIISTINLSEQINGKPKYVIAKGSQDGLYHAYQYSSNGTYRAMAGVGNGNIILSAKDADLAQTTGEKTTTSETKVVTQDVIINDYADIKKTTINGNKNVNITTKDGDNTISVNATGEVNINVGDGNRTVNVAGGIVATEYLNQHSEEVLVGDAKTTTTPNTQTEKVAVVTVAGGTAYTYDPLVIDFNQDGKISAEAGKGIDIDGNGTADGAATGGDKMLAMTDINGNGTIDGQEVFGDKTVNPFTGEKLNAANGFEALKMMAISAQAYTNIKCIDEKGVVDLKALNKALEIKGIKLGFVSDENNSQIEELSKVAYINTNEYKDQKQTGSVQINQIGTSIFEDGTEAIAADVWFESVMPNNPFDFSKLKNLIMP